MVSLRKILFDTTIEIGEVLSNSSVAQQIHFDTCIEKKTPLFKVIYKTF